MIALTDYSSRKVIAEQVEEPAVIDYRKEAVLNPVKSKWEWQFKGGTGNLMKTTVGRVVVRNCEGDPIHVIKFDGKIKRNNAVSRMMDRYRARKFYTVNVEFD
jgi:hypothetical protein